MTILEQLEKALEASTPNILGNRFAEIYIGGDTYSVNSSYAGSHQSANSWGRKDFKKNGKKIAAHNIS